MNSDAILSVREISVEFPIRSTLLRRQVGSVKAVTNVSLDVEEGSILALVGESGCGKTTLARTICGLQRPTRGQIEFQGSDRAALTGGARRRLSRDIQMVFQDPFASLNPRISIAANISAGWRVHRDIVPRNTQYDELMRLMEMVGLDRSFADRYPHQLSGGQQQRVGIARALALRPKLLICDEPVSALDVSIQAQVLNLLSQLRDELGLTIVLVAHDLAVVRAIADDVIVMYLGKIMEQGTPDAVYSSPAHPFTQALLSAAASLSGEGKPLAASSNVPRPSAADPPSGCVFRTRCDLAQDLCADEEPALVQRAGDHPSACHFAEARPVLQAESNRVVE